MAFTNALMLTVESRKVNTFVISESANNINLFDVAGGKSEDADFVFIVNNGVEIKSSSTASPALTTGNGWEKGAVIKIVNYGKIIGLGGAGGIIVYNEVNGFVTDTLATSGGDAIKLEYDCTITNMSSGIIGGGGGGSETIYDFTLAYQWAGDGGAGFGKKGSLTFVDAFGSSTVWNGVDGLQDTGGGYVDAYNSPSGIPYHYIKSLGDDGWYLPSGVYSGAFRAATPNRAGKAGYAVRKNGFNVSWGAGNNAAQVKGQVA